MSSTSRPEGLGETAVLLAGASLLTQTFVEWIKTTAPENDRLPLASTLPAGYGSLLALLYVSGRLDRRSAAASLLLAPFAAAGAVFSHEAAKRAVPGLRVAPDEQHVVAGRPDRSAVLVGANESDQGGG